MIHIVGIHLRRELSTHQSWPAWLLWAALSSPDACLLSHTHTCGGGRGWANSESLSTAHTDLLSLPGSCFPFWSWSWFWFWTSTRFSFHPSISLSFIPPSFFFFFFCFFFVNFPRAVSGGLPREWAGDPGRKWPVCFHGCWDLYPEMGLRVSAVLADSLAEHFSWGHTHTRCLAAGNEGLCQREHEPAEASGCFDCLKGIHSL